MHAATLDQFPDMFGPECQTESDHLVNNKASTAQ